MAKPVLGNDPFQTAASPTEKPSTRRKSPKKDEKKEAGGKKAATPSDKAKKPAPAKPGGAPSKSAKTAQPVATVAKPAKSAKPAATVTKPAKEATAAAPPKTAKTPPPAPEPVPTQASEIPKVSVPEKELPPPAPSVPEHPGEALPETGAIPPRVIGGGDVRLLRLLRPEAFDIGQEFGLDPAFRESLHPLLQFLYRHYWRVTVKGVENLPRDARAVLVANHAGILPFDALMLGYAVRRESGRDLWPLIEDLFYHAPILGPFLSKAGCVRACQENAQRLLAEEQLVAVFPEGTKGVVKSYRQRYRLQRFGRGGFVKLCLQTDSPALPVAIVGSEEAHPLLVNLASLAKLLGLPYFPLTPLFPWLGPLGILPLPSKWTILIGEPIYINQFGPEAAGDRVAVNRLSNQVKAQIQKMIDMEIGSRRSRWH